MATTTRQTRNSRPGPRADATSIRPVLELSTRNDRQTITIDGTPYELRAPLELGLAALTRLQRVMPLLGAHIDAAGTGTLTESGAEEMSTQLTEVCRMALIEVPDTVQAALSDTARALIAQEFLKWLPAQMQAVRPAAASR